jgi:RNA polymerase primary sigma factor
MDDSLKYYRYKIRGIPVIEKESIIRLLEKARAGNKAARNKIIESYLKLVVSFSKHYHGRHVSQADLISHGNLGLFDAIDKFDFNRGTSFTTFAAVRIRKNMTKCLRDEDNDIRIPYGLHDLISREKKSKELTSKQKELVKYANSAKQVCSINCCVGEDEHNEMVDFLPGSYTNLRRIDFKILRDGLSSREKKVIDLRVVRGMTLEDISIKMKISRERVRQIEAKAISKMTKMEKKYAVILDHTKA